MELARGAEAVLMQTKDGITKSRVPKSYRHPSLDIELRKKRTKAEARMMKKAAAAGVPVPTVSVIDETTLHLENIDGSELVSILDSRPELAAEVGTVVRALHDADLMHGDLTTSNMIFSDKLFLIDFGLAFHSKRIEDKAVDLHVFKQSLQSRHYMVFQKAWKHFTKSYGDKNVLSHLHKVEARGRNK